MGERVLIAAPFDFLLCNFDLFKFQSPAFYK